MSPALRILMVEDVPTDAALVEREIRKAGIDFVSRRVETRETFLAALEEFEPDFILSDYSLPAFDGMSALRLAGERAPHVPFIIITGSLNEETAVECIKAGADDYILKDRLARLVPAIQGALEKRRLQRNSRDAAAAMRASEIRYRRLFEAAKDGILILDGETGLVADANPFILKILGYAAKEALGKSIWDLGFLRDVVPSKAAFAELLEKRYVRYEDMPLEAKDGSKREVEFVSNVYAVDGRPVIQCNIRDITERKLAERALRESEARYRLLFERNLAGVYRSTPEGEVLDCNEALAKIYGFASREEMLAQSAQVFYPSPGDRLAFLERLRRQRVLKNLVSQGRRRDGTPIWVLENVSLVFDEKAGRELIEGTILDITEQRRAEEDLRALSEEQRTIFDSIPATIWYKDSNNRILRVNRAASQLMGLPIDKIEGRSSEELFPEFAEGYYRDDQEVIRSGEPKLGIVEPIRTASGELRWLRTDKVPYRNSEGRITGLIAFSLDITQQRETEAQKALLSAAIEQSHETIVVTDREGVIIYVNPAFERLTGYSAQEALGQNPKILKSGMHNRAFYERLWSTILEGQLWAGRFINRKKDGTLFTEQAVISPVRDASGAITNFVAAKRDITQELEMQRRFEQSKNLETVGMIAGGVAHEVRNPLFAISTIVTALERKLSERPEFGEYVMHIQDQTRRLNALMNDLLALGRPIEADHFALLDLRDVLADSKAIVKAGGLETSACLFDLGDEPLKVLGIAAKLQQLFANLGQNALSFSPPESKVQVRARREDKYACVTVSDGGPGIPADLIPRLFQPFQTGRKGGTGLGLAIVRQIVTAHGGTVEAANNDPPPGATFTVRLPLAEASHGHAGTG